MAKRPVSKAGVSKAGSSKAGKAARARPAPSPPITRAQGRRIMALMSRISRQIDRLARR